MIFALSVIKFIYDLWSHFVVYSKLEWFDWAIRLLCVVRFSHAKLSAEPHTDWNFNNN